MFSPNWFSAVISYALESSIELFIIFLVIKVVTWIKGFSSPAVRSRFLLLPLIIPVIFSPALHLIFPSLERFAIIIQIEKAFPILDSIRSYEHYFAPFLLLAFFLLLTYNLLTGFAVSLREIRSESNIKFSAHLIEHKILNHLANQFTISRPLLTISTRHPKTAYVFGWRHPIVILGKEWTHLLDSEEVEAVFAHELAHFKRGDNWQVLIAKTCRDLMFFNPLAHFVYNEYNETLEQAADDLALQFTHKPLALASTLLKFWHVQQTIITPAGNMGFASRPHQLEKRIHRLCNYSTILETTQSSNGLFYSLSVALTVVLSII